MLSRLIASLILTSLAVLAGACPARDGSISRDERVDAEWGKQIEVIEDVLKGGVDIEDRYLRACIFFEKLTGIAIRGEMNYIGWMPNEKSEEDFLKVKQWYAQNHDKLCWSERSESVVLCQQLP